MGDDLWYDIYEDTEEYEDYSDDAVHWEDGDFEDSSFHQILHTCAIPAINDILLPLGKLFLSCCIVRFCISLGSQMILSMKVISLAFDMDTKQISQLPPILNYFSYCFAPSTVIFGPWTSYNDYGKVISRTSVNNLWWILRFFCNFVVALLFLTTSTCWTSWLFKGDLNPSGWVAAYGDALAFRSSHYFVSFVSEASVTIGGFSNILKVSKPQVIEVPRSLVNIVSNWNIPMHCWLKTYVFKVSRPYGTFVAILATYAASSLLHGLNFQLSAVLLSLGFYTFIEYALRSKLACIFDACILSRKCQCDCLHSYKEDHPAVISANVLFGALTLFHLTYLGFMFDGSPELEEKGYNMSHTLSKWGELNYASHWTMLATFIFYGLI